MNKFLRQLWCVLGLASVCVAEPVGHVELIKDVLEFPGLNLHAGLTFEGIKHGAFGLSVGADLLSAFDDRFLVRVGYTRHDDNVWHDGKTWEASLFSLRANVERLGIKTPFGMSLGVWLGNDTAFPFLSREALVGGLEVLHNF